MWIRGGWLLRAMGVGVAALALAGCGGSGAASSTTTAKGQPKPVGGSLTVPCGSGCQDAATPGNGPATGASKIRIDSTGTVASNGAVVPVVLTCSDSASCQGTLLLTDSAAPCLSGGPGAACLGRFTLSLSPNGTQTLNLHLSGLGQTELKKQGRVAIQVIATQNGFSSVMGNLVAVLRNPEQPARRRGSLTRS